MTFGDFHKNVFAVLHAIQDELAAHPPTEEMTAPRDWPAMQAIVRCVAEDLILCSNVPSTVATLRADKGALLCVVYLTTESSDEAVAKALKEAYADAPEGAAMLPGHAFSVYLLRLSEGVEPRA